MKQWARRSKSLIVAYKIYQNWLMRRRFASGMIESDHGSTHRTKTVAESLNYIDAQFSDYLTYSGLTEADLPGKRILELGFGDNTGVALKFIAAGAAQIVCVDKFYSRRSSDQERQIYVALRERLNDQERERFDSAIHISDGIAFEDERLRIINGMDLQQAAASLTKDGAAFDLIISRAVVEEMFDPALVFRAADRLLAPRGLSVHKIDLSDYGIFSDGGMHPLTFLTISEGIYNRMSTDSGIPNRKLIGYYRRVMEELGYSSRIFITGVVGRPPLVPHPEQIELGLHYDKNTISLVDEIRPKLSKEFRDLSTEELMINGIFLVAQKPADSKS